MFNSLLSFNESILQVIRPMVDVFVLSIIFYFIFKFFSGVKSSILLNFVVIIILVYVCAALFNLSAVLWVFKGLLSWIIIGALMVFQPELRSLVSKTNYSTFFDVRKRKRNELPRFTVIKQALEFLIRAKRGALLVFPRSIDLESILGNRIELDAQLSAELLESIFSYDTPLHDGAVVIVRSRIQYAGCYLPIESSSDIPPELGSRHRAALSLSRNSDAIIVVLSEEHGSVSLAYNDQMFYNIGIDKAFNYATKLFRNEEVEVSWFNNYIHMTKDQSSQEDIL